MKAPLRVMERIRHLRDSNRERAAQTHDEKTAKITLPLNQRFEGGKLIGEPKCKE